MADYIYHMVHYREFVVSGATANQASLEQLLRLGLSANGAAGLSKWESIGDRLMPMLDGSGTELVLNRVADLKSAVFGEMCLVHQDAMQALLDLKAQKAQLSAITLAEIYDLTEKSAPKGQVYVKGISYFLSIGNHLFFIRGQSITATHIENYIFWLLSGLGSGHMGGQADFHSKFDRSAYAGDIGDIQALRISGPSFPQMSIAPTGKKQERERGTTRKIAEKFVQFGQAFEIAKTLLGPTKAEELAASLGPKERLVVDASLKVRGSRTLESRQKLSEIAKGLDSMTDGIVGVEGRDGRVSDGDVILRTKMPFQTISPKSSLLDFYSASDQLQAVYQRFVEDKKISA